MPRTFDGVNDKIVTALGSALNTFSFGPATMAAIVKSASDAGSGSPVHVGASSTSPSRYNIQVAATVLKGRTRNTVASAPTITVAVADGWCLIAMTKATGTVVPRFHKRVLSSGVSTHENSVTSLADTDVIAVGAQFGAGEGAFTGDVLIGGVWDRVLGDAEVESLASSFRAWIGARALWRLDQALTTQKVLDLSGGNANESSLTGTAIGSASVPIFGYGASVTDTRPVLAPGRTAVSIGDTAGTQSEAIGLNSAPTTTAAVAAGESIFVLAWVANTRTFVSCSDSAGNTYVRDASTGTNPNLALFSCHNAIPLAAGSFIAPALSSATTAAKGCCAMKVSGLASSGAFDVSATGAGSSAAWASAATAALAQLNEIAVYVTGNADETTANTPDPGWTDVNDFATTGAAAGRLVMGYQNLTSQAAVTASGTMGGQPWVAIVGTYKAAPATVPAHARVTSQAAMRAAVI